MNCATEPHRHGALGSLLGVPALQFRILGPLELRDGTRSVPLGGDRQRTLLAHLLLNLNHQQTPDQLIETVWPSGPPASANANLQTYVHRLRKLMPPLPEGEGLLTQGGQYTMALAPERLDATLFEQLTARAAVARRDGAPAAALRLLDEAEALWRGTPLQDLPTASAWDAELGRLIEARLTATEDRLALRIAEGRQLAAVDGELAELLGRHPYRERLWQQRLLAMDRAGRRAEALELYRRVRDRFVADLGIEPGADLRDTHLAILRGEHPVPGGTPGTGIRPDAIALHQLPPDVADFTGRDHELGELRDGVKPAVQAGAPTVTVLAGAPGDGKVGARGPPGAPGARGVPGRPALRRPAGHRRSRGARRRARRPAAPAGRRGEALPRGLDARAALFRSRLAGQAGAAGAGRRGVGAGRCARCCPPRSVRGAGHHPRPDLRRGTARRQLDLDVLAEREARQLLGRIAGRRAGAGGAGRARPRSCGTAGTSRSPSGSRAPGWRAGRGWSLRHVAHPAGRRVQQAERAARRRARRPVELRR